MIQVAICDDESLVAHQLESIIWDTCNSAGIKVDTEVYNSGFALEKISFIVQPSTSNFFPISIPPSVYNCR